MPHPTLEACSPTIMRHQLSNNALEEDSMETAKEYFEGGDPEEFFRTLFLSKESNRQKLLNYHDFAGELSKSEDEQEIFKDIVRCLGDFPKYEKKFLINFLECTSASQDDKFTAVEEVIFSKTDEFLLRFVEAEKDDNIKIINYVAKALNNQNITNAVEAAFEIKEGSTIDPFPTLEELYTIREDGRSMKRTYELCRDTKLRKVFLKNLILEADQGDNIVLVAKMIFSHCYIDLDSILNETIEEDEIRDINFMNFTPPYLSKIKELSCLKKIKGPMLREMIEKAFNGI